MSDIFVSYEKSDLPMAETLAQALGESGWSIFYDRTISIGSTWRTAIGKELDNARCVVVLWSMASIDSHWVLDEADDARGRGILIPILIQNVRPPMGFRGIQAGNLADWNGTKSAKAFQKLVADITKLIGAPPKARYDEQGSPTLPQTPETKPETGGKQAEPAPIRKIFLSHRRDDSGDMADRLASQLSAELPGVSIVISDVFLRMDVPPNANLTGRLKAEVAGCDVLLAIIGPRWLDIREQRNRLRLTDPSDFVRVEISAALEQDIRTIPILIDGATMPDRLLLPDELKGLASPISVYVSRTHLDYDVRTLVGMLKRVSARPHP